MAGEHRYPRSHRLSGPAAFDAVYAARVRASRGPLTVFGRPNDLAHSRLGLSVSRRVGSAVRRNRIKRLLREAYRLKQDEVARGYDIVVTVRSHEPATLEKYMQWLVELTQGVDLTWRRRAAAPRTDAEAPVRPGSPGAEG